MNSPVSSLLQNSEEHYRLLIDSIKDCAICMLDTQGQVISWNSGAERIKGYKAEEIVGQHFSCFYLPADLKQGKPEYELQVAMREGQFEDEGWRVRKDDSQFWANVVITALYDAQGQLRGFSKVTRDITARKQAEERLRRVIESAPSAMVMASAQGEIVLINSQTEKLFGYRREELIGQPIEVLVPESLRSHHPGYRRSFLQAPQTRAMGAGRDLFARRKDGSEFPVEIGLNPIETEEGVMVLSAIVDITARKQAEDAIRASLKEKEVLLKEIHHRVKNNLQIIVSLLNLQANTVKDPTVLQTFVDSQHRIRAMALIHEQLYQTLDLATVDLAEYARNLTAYLFRAYRGNGTLISLKVETEPAHLRMDTAIPCGLILNELVSNALKHAFPAGRQGEIRISLRADPEEHLTLRVSDDGVGFPSGLDFRQTRSLGLQLVTTLTEQLQGTIELQHHGGTAFQIRFPAA